MTDHKALIKIEFSIYGKDYKTEMYINYFSENGDLDQRIIDWFRECYSEAHLHYEQEVAKYLRSQK